MQRSQGIQQMEYKTKWKYFIKILKKKANSILKKTLSVLQFQTTSSLTVFTLTLCDCHPAVPVTVNCPETGEMFFLYPDNSQFSD